MKWFRKKYEVWCSFYDDGEVGSNLVKEFCTHRGAWRFAVKNQRVVDAFRKINPRYPDRQYYIVEALA